MSPTYATNSQVSAFLQLNSFSGSTNPTDTTVDDLIENNEDYIDQRTGHAWRTKTITEEYQDPITPYKYGTGIAFKLSRRQITQFASGTDKFEIWDGTQFIDYVATKTEGRNNDYWVDYTNGVVYLLDRSIIYPKGVRFTYRYGDSTVTKDVRKLAILLTAIDLVTMYEKQIRFIEDGSSDRQNDRDKAELWSKQVEMLFKHITEITVI